MNNLLQRQAYVILIDQPSMNLSNTSMQSMVWNRRINFKLWINETIQYIILSEIVHVRWIVLLFDLIVKSFNRSRCKRFRKDDNRRYILSYIEVTMISFIKVHLVQNLVSEDLMTMIRTHFIVFSLWCSRLPITQNDRFATVGNYLWMFMKLTTNSFGVFSFCPSTFFIEFVIFSILFPVSFQIIFLGIRSVHNLFISQCTANVI